mmetsp:Transcript_16909/g.52518  ORF Transcript_16909/g.52518 Transcript_16909/m.52518 type:complete len:160 (+) Transcript_16909:611-1090(+)
MFRKAGRWLAIELVSPPYHPRNRKKGGQEPANTHARRMQQERDPLKKGISSGCGEGHEPNRVWCRKRSLPQALCVESMERSDRGAMPKDDAGERPPGRAEEGALNDEDVDAADTPDEAMRPSASSETVRPERSASSSSKSLWWTPTRQLSRSQSRRSMR